jgi:autotransporter translocation and assembly factor TamB
MNDDNLNVDVWIKLDKFGITEVNNFNGKFSGNISIKGDVFKMIKISGDIYTDNGEVDITGFITKSLRAIEILDISNSKNTRQKPIELPIKVPIDIKMTLKDGFRIKGYGIDSVWSGGGRVFGDISNVEYEMKITLMRGSVRIPGRLFKLKDGIISTMSSDPDVYNVNISAIKSFGTIKVGARFVQDKSGSRMNFFSKPYVSRKDMVSYLLFDKPSSDISVGEGMTLLVMMNGIRDGGPGVIDKMWSIFGIDTVELKKVANEKRGEYDVVSFGKSLGNRAKILIDQGGGRGTTKVVLETKVSKRAKISVDVSGKDSMSAGVFWNKRY